jgi:polysaccharide biosynthesis transport protein
MDVISLFRSLLEKKWIILLAGLLAGGIAFYLTRNAPKYYRSTSQISTGFTISDIIKVGNEDFNLYEADVKFNNAISTITSPSVISYLSYQLILHDLESKTPFRNLTEKQMESPLYQQVNKETARQLYKRKLDSLELLTSFKKDERRLLEYLALYGYDYKTLTKSLNVYRLQRTDYIQIDFFSENPELSAFVVNNLYSQFITYYKKIRSTTSQESVDTLKSIMDKKKMELDYKRALSGGAYAVNGAQSSYDLVTSFEQSLSIEKSKLANLYAELRKIDQRLAALGVKVQPSTSPSLANNEELLVLRKSMNDTYAAYLNSGSKDNELLNRYNQLKTEYQNKVAALNKPVTPVTERPTETKEELLTRKRDVEIDVETTTESITSLQTKITNLRSAANSAAARGASAEAVAREVEQANTEYIMARQKYNDALATSSGAVNNFKQVLTGQPAITPEPSKRLIYIGLAVVSTILSCILIITLLFYFDSSVKTPSIFARSVGLKLISIVNFMNLKNKQLDDIITGTSDVDDRRQKNKHNVFRESLRKLRYEIESSGKKIILFASTKKGQGKTTLIMSLAHSLSLSKNKILIIDTNFSNNDLTVELGGTPVLEKLAYTQANNIPIYEHVMNNAVAVRDDSIYIIGSEGGDYTPAEILPKENILQHLSELKNRFDYIFLEGPPLNDFSDAKELSVYAEAVVGVFSATEMIKQIDKESISFFRSLKEKYLGSILNMVDFKNMNVA